MCEKIKHFTFNELQEGNDGKMWILNSVLPTELFIVRAIFVNPHQNFISNDKADWTRAIQQNTILRSKYSRWNISRDVIYLSGNLRYGLQGEISADRHDGGAEGDQAGARGGRPLHGHQGGLSAEGPETRKYR